MGPIVSLEVAILFGGAIILTEFSFFAKEVLLRRKAVFLWLLKGMSDYSLFKKPLQKLYVRMI